MSAPAPVLGDPLGPRGRRRARVGSVIVLILIIVALALAVRQFAVAGQLDADRWSTLGDPRVIQFLLSGLLSTLAVAGVAMIGATLLGALLALGRLSSRRWVQGLAGVYVECLRTFPLLLLIFFTARLTGRYEIGLSTYWILVLALTANNAAVMSEIFRAGIRSLPVGQSEAAQALGLSHGQALRLVVLPQAIRNMVPTLVSQLVTLFKDSSLGFVLPFEELLRRGQVVGEFSGAVLQAYLVVAVIYTAVAYAGSRVAGTLRPVGTPPMASKDM